MQVVISPQSLLETGIRVEKVDDLRLFKFTDDLQDKLEELVVKSQYSSTAQQSLLQLIDPFSGLIIAAKILLSLK